MASESEGSGHGTRATVASPSCASTAAFTPSSHLRQTSTESLASLSSATLSPLSVLSSSAESTASSTPVRPLAQFTFARVSSPALKATMPPEGGGAASGGVVQASAARAQPVSQHASPARATPVMASAAPLHATPVPAPAAPLTHVNPAAALKRGQGFSCHHCKTHKMPELLLFCSNQSKKGPGKKRCRKKYCDSCLKRLYGHPPDQPLSAFAAGFQCPACLGNCVCAGCERKAAPNQSSHTNSANGGMSSAGEQLGDDRGLDSSNSSSSSSVSPQLAPPTLSLSSSTNRQPKPTTPQGKPPGKKRRTSMDSDSIAIEATELQMQLSHDSTLSTEEDDSSSTGTSEEPPATSFATPPMPSAAAQHVRRSSIDLPMPAFHISPSHSFIFAPNNPPPPHPFALPPRMAVAVASPASVATNRMIHIPAFPLLSPTSLISGINPAMSTSAGGGSNVTPASALFASQIQQSVSAATSIAAAAVATQVASIAQAHAQTNSSSSAMDVSDNCSSNNGSTHVTPLLASISTGSSNGALNGAGAGSIPALSLASSSASSTPTFGPRVHSAFSPVHAATAFPTVDTDAAMATLVSSSSSSSSSSSTPATLVSHSSSPGVSPSIFKRLMLTGEGVISGAASASASSTAPSTVSTSKLPSGPPFVVPPPSLTPPLTADTEPMKVLANLACSSSVANPNLQLTLPPTHPGVKTEASPKLTFMPSASSASLSGLLSIASSASSVSTSSSTSSLPSSSLASISALKAQHALEVQCLLQQQALQLAELEQRALKELELQQQQHHQSGAAAASSSNRAMSSLSSNVAAGLSPHTTFKLPPPAPRPVEGVKLEPSDAPAASSPPLSAVVSAPSLTSAVAAN